MMDYDDTLYIGVGTLYGQVEEHRGRPSSFFVYNFFVKCQKREGAGPPMLIENHRTRQSKTQSKRTLD